LWSFTPSHVSTAGVRYSGTGSISLKADIAENN
jgi:hypothetical protein